MASFQDLIDESMGVPSRGEDRRARIVRDYARDALKGGLIARVRCPAQCRWKDFSKMVAECAFDIGEAMADEEERRAKRNEEAS